MLLYLAGRSPNPRRVQFFLAEKGIEVPTRTVDIGAKENRLAEFLEINPRATVPVLVLDDGTPIAESIAICRYFEAVQPEPNLFGADAREIGLVDMWQRRAEIELMQAVQFAFRHVHPAMAEREIPQVKEWGEANKPKVLDFLGFMDRELAGREYLALDRFTVADITAIVAIDFMRVARITAPEEFTNLARWRAAVSARPAAAAGA
ncbi:glutathione S-transferase [Azorhizobium oxalatiphilum]|uniref:Glutathione S-transferase n=1 Tax=Azorhizobium oxalatiphilum TaxID=980631 RepID=A0A917BPD9_9HYPH|nr:glutathione S-transferase [Azorhizobium oxalatiphilum]GGF51754.1 glutathione S-transferase [Azorhizobium oxalatiphilum]